MELAAKINRRKMVILFRTRATGWRWLAAFRTKRHFADRRFAEYEFAQLGQCRCVLEPPGARVDEMSFVQMVFDQKTESLGVDGKVRANSKLLLRKTDTTGVCLRQMDGRTDGRTDGYTEVGIHTQAGIPTDG